MIEAMVESTESVAALSLMICNSELSSIQPTKSRRTSKGRTYFAYGNEQIRKQYTQALKSRLDSSARHPDLVSSGFALAYAPGTTSNVNPPIQHPIPL